MRLSNLLLAALATPLLAHPGEKHDENVVKRELKVRDAVANMGKRGLDTCSTSLEARNLDRKNVQRRAETVRMLKKKKGLYGSKCSGSPLFEQGCTYGYGVTANMSQWANTKTN